MWFDSSYCIHYAFDLLNLIKLHFFFDTGKQEGVVLALDNACAEFLADDRVVISLKGGELFVLTLVADSMRSVRNFHLDKSASSVLTCCVSGSLNIDSFVGVTK